MTDISILIPNYNGICTSLVSDLQQQVDKLPVHYEILVADDGSTDATVITANRAINQLPHCCYLERPQNVGRAAIRNFLATESQYPWLLFIDSDMVVCRNNFLQQYLSHQSQQNHSPVVIYGGVCIGPLQPGNLRSMYEKSSEHEHTLACRLQQPYHDFHTANFMVPRELMLQHPFDLRFRQYGYEDVLFGKQLRQLGIPILHIDNPLSFEKFENNSDFISKTEEGLRTLCQFRTELKGYSRLLDALTVPPRSYFLPLLRLWHRLFGGCERRKLTTSHPSLLLFKLYKAGYFSTLYQ